MGDNGKIIYAVPDDLSTVVTEIWKQAKETFATKEEASGGTVASKATCKSIIQELT